MISHTPFSGAANIEQGITIDLSDLNQVTPSADLSTVTVGPGNRWANVYSKLDALGIAIGGGRVATVGVGGLTLGGTDSLTNAHSENLDVLTSSHRWCLILFAEIWLRLRQYRSVRGQQQILLNDFALTYNACQVVLPSGIIVNATKKSHSDLWLALKGGSNNFGIVTAFESTAFKQGKFW